MDEDVNIKDLQKKIDILHIQNNRLLYYLHCNKNFYKKKIEALEDLCRILKKELDTLKSENIQLKRSEYENMGD